MVGARPSELMDEPRQSELQEGACLSEVQRGARQCGSLIRTHPYVLRGSALKGSSL